MFFQEDQIDISCFEGKLREVVGENMERILLQAQLSNSNRISPAHMLLTCLRDGDNNNSYTSRFFGKFKVESLKLGNILLKEVSHDDGIPVSFTGRKSEFTDDSLKIFEYLEAKVQDYKLKEVDERLFLDGILHHVDGSVCKVLDYADMKLDVLIRSLQDDIDRTYNKKEPRIIFGKEDGVLVVEHFDLAMQEVLRKLCDITAKTGHMKITSLHLFLALSMWEKGITFKGLSTQAKNPNVVAEELMNYLKRPGAAGNREKILLEKNFMWLSVYQVFLKSAEIAADDNVSLIGESQFIRALFKCDVQSELSELFKMDIDCDFILKMAEDEDNKKPVTDLDFDDDPNGPVNLAELEQTLNRKIVGQSFAVERVLPWIRRFRFGLTRVNKPIGAFLLMGPSSVGKTQLAKEIASALFGNANDHMIFIDMSSFNSEESANRFIGAPPGYVGYGEGQLTNGLRDKPESVILLDEVEKAHAKVFDGLLALLAEGKISDASGAVRDASRSVVIMTSNLKADELMSIKNRFRSADLKNDHKKAKEFNDAVRAQLVNFFRPEFINRIDEIILFNSLRLEDLKCIAMLEIEQFAENFKKQKKVDLIFENKEVLAEYIAWLCDSSRRDEGGRGPGKVVDSWLSHDIIEYFLKSEIEPDSLDKLPITFLRDKETLNFG